MISRARATLAPLAKSAFRALIPLGARKRLAVAVGRSRWIRDRYYWSMEAVRDLAEREPDEFHRFLWANHLAYAETYEPEQRFSADNLHASRRLLFEELHRVLLQRGIVPSEVRSVLEVGCSLGYLLRHMETAVFPAAEVLDGLDIDRPAIDAGATRLRAMRSRVRLLCADMAELDARLGGRRYDLVFSAGTLMYLNERAASGVVASMLARTDRLLVLTGLADPARDNGELDRSGVRQRDRSFIHNLDRMVESAGGTVVARRWDGPTLVDGNTIYFVFAEPAPRAAVAGPVDVAIAGGGV